MNYDIPAEVKKFLSKEELFRQIADELKEKLEESSILRKYFYLAVSGGSTPLLLFELIGREYIDLPWETLRLFWVDERMVTGDDIESNYGTAKRIMLEHIPLPSSNIHFINGSNAPELENVRYSSEIRNTVPLKNNLPAFDLIWLGLGVDGHTASLFPGKALINSTEITGISEHPITGQKRITLTEQTINNANEVIFIVTGSEKVAIVNEILGSKRQSVPAARIKPVNGKFKWYLCF